MRTPLLLAFTASLLAPLPAQNPGQDSAPSTTPTTVVKPLAGLRAGTESWIVHFESRPFDLRDFRAEMHGGKNPDVIDRIVRGLEFKMQAHQEDFVEAVESLGGRVTHQWWLINGCAIEIAPKHLDAIRDMKNVARLEADTERFPQIKSATDARNHNSDALNARGVTGLGVACAIIDSGQDSNRGGSGRPHITYSKRGSSQSRLVANVKVGAMPADDIHGHGTGVASIAAGWKWRSAQADHGHAYDANIVGYAIANNMKGSSSDAVQASAYQRAARDAARFKIVSTNMSYGGSPNPASAVNLAMDSAALNADLFNATAAGNNGNDVTRSVANLSGISVGAVAENTHRVASFSSRGVQRGRLFPDMCANGVSTDMAKRDNEYGNYISDGTSMASPQVCGAATLIRGVNRNLKADETRAILLASTAKNPGAGSGLNSTGTGAGYLRDDVAYKLATSSKSYGRASVSNGARVWRRSIAVTRGNSLQIAVVWNRLNVSSSGTTWSNLDLHLKRGGQSVASSRTSMNTEEFIRYVPTASETLTIEVTLTGNVIGGSAQPFAWSTHAENKGQYSTYGTGCKGSGRSVTGGIVVPKGFDRTWGSTANSYPFGIAPMRYMQAHAASQFTGTHTVRGLAFRSGRNIAQNANTLSLTVKVGYTRQHPQFLSNTFDSNWYGTPTTGFTGKLNVPAMSAQTNPGVFTLKIPFHKPFVYSNRTGHFLWECQNAGQTSTKINYYDAVSSQFNPACRVFYGGSSTAKLGIVTSGFSLVTQILRDGGSGATVALSNSGVPETGASFRIHLSGATQNSAAVLWLGARQTNFSVGGIAPGCSVYTSFDIPLVTVSTGSTGSAAVAIGLPNNQNLVGIRFYNQWLVLDRKANQIGVVTSNGGAGVIGG